MDRNASLERENGGLVKEIEYLKKNLESKISGNRMRTYLLGLLTMVIGIQQAALQGELSQKDKVGKVLEEKTKSINDRLVAIDRFNEDLGTDSIRADIEDIKSVLDEKSRSVFDDAVQATEYYFTQHPTYNPESGNFQDQKSDTEPVYNPSTGDFESDN